MARSAPAVSRPRCVAAALLTVLVALFVGGAWPAHAVGASDARAVVAFLPAGGDDNPKPVLERLDVRTALALGLVSATQGRFDREQMVLDMTSGSRTSRA